MFERTHETMTAGIVNIPLTKPARLFFYIDSNGKQILDMFQSYKIGYQMIKLPSGKIQVISLEELHPSVIKNIFHNFRSLKPKLFSNWRYLFWEIDNQELENLNIVTEIYRELRLPYYCHKTMRGYHFISVKPILKDIWQNAISLLRPTNESFPPVTLRVLANKYYHELKFFQNGYIVSGYDHSDTEQIRRYINNQDLQKLQEHYFIVWYKIPQQEDLDKMNLDQRTVFQDEQI